jgi:hypothetical protein
MINYKGQQGISMTTDLTTEEIVTRLLNSKEILTPKTKDFYVSTDSNLGDYLKKISKTKKSKEPSNKLKDSKYSFINSELWNL